MIRNLKVLGLALVAVLAMSAMAASAASADDLTSESTPVTLTGKQSGAGDVFTTTAGTVKCKEVSYTASTATPTTTVTATPSYPAKTAGGEQNCTGFGFPAEVVTNGCKYVFTINGAGSTAGSLKIECPESKEITVTATSGATVKCTVHVPGQTIASGITYSNTGSGTTREIKIAASISGALSYKHTAGSGVGACTSGSAVNGSYAGEGTVTGHNNTVEKEDEIGGGVKIKTYKHVGIFLS